ncbi:MAG: dynamin family protein, partial [Cytophagales bacterium]|nr:dynamin family protein [Cytophagales bacterium]
GKSSLLERLSGVPFPRGASLCTRAKIELRMRRDPEQEVANVKVCVVDSQGKQGNEELVKVD